MFERRDLGDRGVDRCGRGWIVDGAIVHVEHDHRGCSGTFREALLEQVDGGLRLHTRHPEVVDRITPGDPVQPHQAQHCDHPGHEDEPMVGSDPTTQSVQPVRHDTPPASRQYMQSLHFCNDCSFLDSLRSWPNQPDDENGTSVSADADSKTSRSNCSNARASTRRPSSRSLSEAELAPRTFFSYFATKDDLVLADYSERLERILTEHEQRPEDEPAWDALRASFAAVAADYESEHDRIRRRFTIMASNPSVFARSLHLQAGWEQALTQRLTTRLGARADDPHHACSQQRRSRSCAPPCSTGSLRRTPPHCQLWSRAASTNSPAASARTEAAPGAASATGGVRPTEPAHPPDLNIELYSR